MSEIVTYRRLIPTKEIKRARKDYVLASAPLLQPLNGIRRLLKTC